MHTRPLFPFFPLFAPCLPFSFFPLCLSVLGLALSFSSAWASSLNPTVLESDLLQARSLLESGQSDQAYALYMQLLRAAPNQPELNLGLAEAAIELKHYAQALLAFERISNQFPADVTVRLRMVRMYQLLEDFEAAHYELVQALACAPPELVPAMEEILATFPEVLETRPPHFNPPPQPDTNPALSALQKLQIHGRISMGLQYDTNVNLGPENDSIQLGAWRVRIPGIAAEASSGLFTQAHINTTYPLQQGSPWLALVEGSAFHKRNILSDRPAESFYWGQVGLGLRRVSPSLYLETKVRTDIARQEILDGRGPNDETNWNEVRSTAAEGTLVYGFGDRISLLTQGMLEQRSYEHNPKRKGWYSTFGQHINVSLTDSFSLMTGLRLHLARPEYQGFHSASLEGSISGSWSLPWNLSLQPFAAYKETRYAQPATIFERENRLDRTLTYGTRFQYQFSPQWVAAMGWHNTHNSSSSSLYTYRQTTTSASLTWKF